MSEELLPSSAEMRALDAAAIEAGHSGLALMTRAGRAVADRAAAMAGGRPILVLCGPGNNGGDGFVAARLLAEGGLSVELAALKPASEMTGDAGRAAGEWRGEVGSLADADVTSAGLIVDALFGTGLGRDLSGTAADVVRRANGGAVPVLSVDIPSGIDAGSGQVRGVAFEADWTVALAARKPGHLLDPGRDHAGTVEVADLGIPDGLLKDAGIRTSVNGPRLWSSHLPRPGRHGHKYDRGHTLVVSGPPLHTGAARLAARGALRAGSGLVTLVTSARALAVNAAHLTAIMLRVADDPDEFSDLLTDDRFNAIALGPALGVGETTRAWVAAALEADRATVLDADAITSFAGAADALASLIRDGREAPVVLTPHGGEFARLFSGDGAAASGEGIASHPSKLDRARRAAAALGATVILKGSDTVIAAPDGRAAINENGSPYLATAGTGDVLGGIVVGLLAQGMPVFEAASAAVWLHAEAGSRFGPGLIAEDLPDVLPAVLRDLLG